LVCGVRFHIGRSITGSQFAGGIDDVHTYQQARSDAEVAAL
jgi:hypothetical protein